MTATAGTARTPMPDLGAKHEGLNHTDTRWLARQAHVIAWRQGDTALSGHQCRAIVREFINTGYRRTSFREWVLSYCDPTGNDATTNVLRERANF